MNRLYNEGTDSYANKDEENQLCYKSYVCRTIPKSNLQTQGGALDKVIIPGHKSGEDYI